MKINVGKTKETAIPITDTRSIGTCEDVVHKFIDNTFGDSDDSYFIHSESNIKEKGRKYKIVLVEDKDKTLHQIWFDTTNVL